MSKRQSSRRRASQKRREYESRRLERIDFAQLTQADFVEAVTYIALRKVRERGAEGHRLGMETEERFFSAFRRADINVPRWFFGVRRANAVDDARGIDAFAITDKGEIPIQIKSSFRGMHSFIAERPGNSITILVIKRDLSLEQILEKTIERVTRERFYRSSRQPKKGKY